MCGIKGRPQVSCASLQRKELTALYTKYLMRPRKLQFGDTLTSSFKFRIEKADISVKHRSSFFYRIFRLILIKRTYFGLMHHIVCLLEHTHNSMSLTKVIYICFVSSIEEKNFNLYSPNFILYTNKCTQFV
jgi:hypothetical protein